MRPAACIFPAAGQHPAIIKPQKPSGYLVRFPDIEEAITQDETIEECLFNAAEVLSLVLDHRIAEGQPVPKPSRVKGARMIAPDAKTQAAVLIRLMRGERPVSELAEVTDKESIRSCRSIAEW